MSFALKVMFPCLFVIMGLVFLAIGGRGIATRKPFLLSARWFLGISLLGLAPSFVMPFVSATPRTGGSLDVLTWLGPAMFVVIAISMWLSLRGYMAFAVTDVSFREGLLAALDKLQLPYEETLGSLRLPSVGADLQIGVQSAMGMGQLRAKQRRHAALLADVVAAMNEYFQSTAVEVNLAGSVFYCVIGVFMLIFAGVFAFQS